MRSFVDIVPAGPTLRAAKQIIWPESQFAMSLVAFDHVFARAVPITFVPGIEFKVAPLSVIALLKIVAYMEDPYRRAKDLAHLKVLFRGYEAESDRIFGDDVFAAELEDFEYTNAFLLGSDVGAIATDEDANIMYAFLNKHRISAPELAELHRDDLHQSDALRFHVQLSAFEKGFNSGRQSRNCISDVPGATARSSIHGHRS